MPHLGAAGTDAGAAISLQLEELVSHCGGDVVEFLLSLVSGSHPQCADHRVSHSSPAPHSRQAHDCLGWATRASQPCRVGVCTAAARTSVAGVSSGLRPGTKPGRVSVVALETARTAELLPTRLWATERSCSPGLTTYASSTYPGMRLLGTGGTLSFVTILCGTQ